MSGKAAQQINELLDKSANKVESTVLRTKEKIGNANELSARCYDFFKLLTDRSGQLKEMVDSISAASAEQNSGVDYVVNAMNDLNNTAARRSDRHLGPGNCDVGRRLKDTRHWACNRGRQSQHLGARTTASGAQSAPRDPAAQYNPRRDQR